MPNATPSLDTIFCEAVEIRDAAARSAYLERACGPDDALRRRVEALIAAHLKAGSFLDQPPPVDSTSAFTPNPGDAPTADGHPVHPGTAIGPYHLRELIGEGGMGLVFVAEQTHPVRRKVALKVIKPGMDSRQVVARFEAERQALALMDHPNIARVLDAGTTDLGRPFFVMELVRGVPVTDYCDTHKLTLRQRLDMFLQVCAAVQHAHQKGVIHRDLKPSNILVAVHDVAPVAKVIDFGIAKAVGQQLTDKTVYTAFAQLVGTPLYMSPEQAGQSSLDVDTRTDVYALGVLLYELLTGTTPFDPDTLQKAGFDEMRRIIREVDPPRPSVRIAERETRSAEPKTKTKTGSRSVSVFRSPFRVPRSALELDWVVMRCLEKDRNRRYDTANGLARDIERYLAGEPVEAHPPSVGYRLRKFARRNRAALATAAAVAVALVAGAGVSAWQMVLAKRAEGRAEARFDQARQVVDEMYTQVAEQWLSKDGLLTPLQRRFLEKALAFYEQIPTSRVDDPAIAREAARVRYRVGVIRRDLGDNIGAEAALREAVDRLAALADRHPDPDGCRDELAYWLIELGSVYIIQDRLAEAEPHLIRSVGLQETLAAGRPEDQNRRLGLARSVQRVGLLHVRQQRWVEAEANLDRSKELLDSVAVRPANSARQSEAAGEAASCLYELGHVYKATGRPQEAERAFRSAIDRVNTIRSDDPTVSRNVRVTKAICGISLGSIYWSDGKWNEAAETLKQAVGTLEALADEAPHLYENVSELARAQRNLIVVLVGAGQEAQAREVGRLAVRRFERSDRQVPLTGEYGQYAASILCHLADLCSTPTGHPLSDPPRAARQAQWAKQLDPNGSLVRQSLGWALYRVGDWNGCLDVLRRPGVDGDYIQAMAHWQLGEREKAREIFDRADHWFAGYEAGWKPTTYPPPAMVRRQRDEAAALLVVMGPGPETAPPPREKK